MKKLFILFCFLIATVNSFAQYYYSEHYYGGRGYAMPTRVVRYGSPVRIIHAQAPQPQPIVINNNIYHQEVVREEAAYQPTQRVVNINNGQYEEVFEGVADTTPTFSTADMWTQTVWFKCGGTTLNRVDNKITLDNVGQFLKTYPNEILEVRGYASRNHGTWGRNNELAKARAINVKNYLINTYRIPSENIITIIVGVNESEYNVDEWNQCVTIKCKRNN